MSSHYYKPIQEWPNTIIGIGNQICFLGRASSLLFQHEVKAHQGRGPVCLPFTSNEYTHTQAPNTRKVNMTTAEIIGVDLGEDDLTSVSEFEVDEDKKLTLISSRDVVKPPSKVINLFSKKKEHHE